MLEEGMIISDAHFNFPPRDIEQAPEAAAPPRASVAALPQPTAFPGIVLPPGGISMEEVERELISQALDRFGGNQTKAARCLKMTRDTLRYRMKKFGFLKENGAGGPISEAV